MSNSQHQSERAKARWSILRDALLKNQRAYKNTDSTIHNITSGNVSESTDISGTVSVNKHSIHKFPGFQMLKRRTIQNPMILDNNNEYEIFEYEVPIGINAVREVAMHRGSDNNDEKNESKEIRNVGVSKVHPCVLARTKERKLNETRLSLQELTSHSHYGVDNTGNTRVWDCSNVLAALIMGKKILPDANLNESSCDLQFSTNSPFLGLDDILSLGTRTGCIQQNDVNTKKMLRVLELGSGMAALPSLALSMLDRKKSMRRQGGSVPIAADIPKIQITITDGHPKAVQNNRACVNLTHSCNDHEVEDESNVQCCKLSWKANEAGANECNELMKCKRTLQDHDDASQGQGSLPFDLILVSDCTHFTDFHADLAVTIGRLVRVGGVCILCQPCRGSSLGLFIDVLHAMNGVGPISTDTDVSPLFQVDLHRDYNKEITAHHLRLLDRAGDVRNDAFYDPNIHYPLILTLKKLREYDEVKDTEKAKERVKNR